MASPRSMWSGHIELGILTIPITIGKAWADEKVGGLMTVCVHEVGGKTTPQPISRSERCELCKGSPENKRTAVIVDEGHLHIFDEDELAHIETSTQTPTLRIQDVQPIKDLPLMFSTGIYYIRHDEKSKVPPKALNRLVNALGKTGYGLICQWGNSSSQKLCVITARRGVLCLQVIPHRSEIRPASLKERAHFSVKDNPEETKTMVELLTALRNPNGFQYDSYQDQGYEMRKQAVDRILAGEVPETEIEHEPKAEPTDIMEALKAALQSAKKEGE
jgi:non-homologous end joining protein Ku